MTPVVVVSMTSMEANKVPMRLALFDETGAAVAIPEAVTPAAAQADSTATTIAELKTDFNALLAKLRTAGLLASS